MDALVRVDVKHEDVNCSSRSPHPTKRACADLAAENVRMLKEEDPVHVPVPVKTYICSTEVSKLDPPAPVKMPPVRYVAFGAAAGDLVMSTGTVGFGQEGQDDKEEDIRRQDDRDKGVGIGEESKDGLKNDDDVNGQEKNDGHLEDQRKKRKRNWNKKFEGPIEELKSFKAKHGHVRFTEKHGQSLASFCTTMRSDRRPANSRAIDRIKALDELGFDWEDGDTSFEERVEELKAFKEKHGHVRVTEKHGDRLYRFCRGMRYARGRAKRTRTRKEMAEDRIKALDELGFEWEDITKAKSFEERVEELKAFKEKHGHVRVKAKHDERLYKFCRSLRCARGIAKRTRKEMTEDKIKALDEMEDETKSSEEPTL